MILINITTSQVIEFGLAQKWQFYGPDYEHFIKLANSIINLYIRKIICVILFISNNVFKSSYESFELLGRKAFLFKNVI